ncbi:MAG TPA: disulfide bond formation protein B [Bacteriovoracaceae bacterium]|nr:disulfide bond formation protein B [Bacteriovoracaceae bacterium]
MSIGWIIVFIAWIISAVSTLGSLFFSEVMMLPPCILCWYQRICMYPLPILLFVGLLKLDKSVFRYTFPLALIGWGFAVYHNLLYYKVLPESASPCVRGISCTTVQLEWLGFITIPLLSLFGFSLILILLFIYRKNYEN